MFISLLAATRTHSLSRAVHIGKIKSMQCFGGVDLFIIALLQSPVLTADTIPRFAEWVDGTNNNRKESPGGVRA